MHEREMYLPALVVTKFVVMSYRHCSKCSVQRVILVGDLFAEVVYPHTIGMNPCQTVKLFLKAVQMICYQHSRALSSVEKAWSFRTCKFSISSFTVAASMDVLHHVLT